VPVLRALTEDATDASARPEIAQCGPPSWTKAAKPSWVLAKFVALGEIPPP
jgi:hypothetical protein